VAVSSKEVNRKHDDQQTRIIEPTENDETPNWKKYAEAIEGTLWGSRVKKAVDLASEHSCQLQIAVDTPVGSAPVGTVHPGVQGLPSVAVGAGLHPPQ
jgi:hypothetical protein